MMTFSTEVAAEVRAAFARRGEGHKELAAALDVSIPTARSRWNAESPLDLDELYRIATHLGVSIADLIPAGSNRVAA